MTTYERAVLLLVEGESEPIYFPSATVTTTEIDENTIEVMVIPYRSRS